MYLRAWRDSLTVKGTLQLIEPGELSCIDFLEGRIDLLSFLGCQRFRLAHGRDDFPQRHDLLVAEIIDQDLEIFATRLQFSTVLSASVGCYRSTACGTWSYCAPDGAKMVPETDREGCGSS